MHDLGASIFELLGTLQKAREAVRADLEMLQAQGSLPEPVFRLLEAARSFADQAQALSLMIEDSRRDEAWLKQANDLAAFFWWAEEAIEAMLGLDH